MQCSSKASVSIITVVNFKHTSAAGFAEIHKFTAILAQARPRKLPPNENRARGEGYVWSQARWCDQLFSWAHKATLIANLQLPNHHFQLSISFGSSYCGPTVTQHLAPSPPKIMEGIATHKRRRDGRTDTQLRPLSIEFGVLHSTDGSARFSIGKARTAVYRTKAEQHSTDVAVPVDDSRRCLASLPIAGDTKVLVGVQGPRPPRSIRTENPDKAVLEVLVQPSSGPPGRNSIRHANDTFCDTQSFCIADTHC